MTNTVKLATPAHWAYLERYRYSGTEFPITYLCLLELRDRLTAAEQRISELEGTQQNHPEPVGVKTTAADVLTQLCFAGQNGLNGLANADSFWNQQAYGTRLYYGDGIMDYLHRDVLISAIQVLEGSRPAPTTCPHIVSSDEGTSYCALAEQRPAPAAPVSAPAGSLVEIVGNVIPLLPDGRIDDKHSSAVILAVADWLDSVGNNGSARDLRKEVER